MKRIIILVLWVWNGYSANAQVNDSRLFTPQDGLVSVEINSVGCDALGRIWACSNSSGVSIYDGKRFEKYTIFTKPAIIANQTFVYCYPDSSVCLWNEAKGATVIRGKSVKNYPMPKVPPMWGGPMIREKSVQMWVNKGNGDYWSLDLERGTSKPLVNFNQKNIIAGDLLPSGFSSSVYYDSTAKKRFILRGYANGKMERIDDPFPAVPAGMFYNYGLTEHQDIIVQCGQKILLYTNHKWQQFTPKTAEGTTYEGVYENFFYHQYRFWALQKLDNKRHRLLEFNDNLAVVGSCIFRTSSDVKGVAKDLSGNYWIATFEGLLRVNPHISTFNEKQEPDMIASIHAVGEDRFGKIWFGSYSEGFAVFDGKTLKKHPPGTDPAWRILPSSLALADGRMLMSRENGSGLLVYDGKKWDTWLDGQVATFLIRQLKDGRLALGSAHKQLGIQKKIGSIPRDSTDWHWIDERKGLKLVNVIGLTEDNFGRIWVGRPSMGFGIYDPKTDSAKTWLIENNETDFGPISCLTDKYGNLWFGTTRGLYFYKPTPQYPSNPFKEFTPVSPDFLGKHRVGALKIWNDKWLVVGNEKGFSLLNLEEYYAVGGKEGRFTVVPFETGKAFSGGNVEQNAVIIDSKDKIWLGYEGGASQIDLANLKIDTTVFKVTIDSINDANAVFLLENDHTLTLNAGERGVQIYFSTLNDPFLSNNFILKYRLVGKTDWVVLTSPESVTLPLLPPNDYTFEFVTIKNGLEGTPQYMGFKIPKIWYKDPWFWFVSMIIAGGLGFLYYRREQRRQRDYTRLQVQAITNQLNPHFINNALNLVQIKTADNADAVDIIDLLSKNIQTVFLNSRNSRPYHSLKEEVQIVENYLFIQKHRFKDDLAFTLPSSEAIEKLGHFLVPLMQILIHCENAIEHGIRNRVGQGHVVIGLVDEGNFVYITIEDDGVGRKKAQEIGSRGTQQGTKMLTDLAVITNRHNREKIQSYYEDNIFTNVLGSRYGTCVHVRIPKNYKYEPD